MRLSTQIAGYRCTHVSSCSQKSPHEMRRLVTGTFPVLDRGKHDIRAVYTSDITRSEAPYGQRGLDSRCAFCTPDSTYTTHGPMMYHSRKLPDRFLRRFREYQSAPGHFTLSLQCAYADRADLLLARLYRCWFNSCITRREIVVRLFQPRRRRVFFCP